MEVALGKFARSCIETHLGVGLDVGIQAALLHYTRRLRSGWEPVGPPLFSRDQRPPDTAAVFELPMSAEILATLQHQARRHQLPVGQVLAHALFVFMADLDSALGGEPDTGQTLPPPPDH